MTILLLLPLLLGNFVLKESIPYGTSGPSGRVLLDDFNGNGNTDVIFKGYSGTFAIAMIFERQDSGVYVLMDTIGFYLAVWGAGDFDADGLNDIVTDGDYFIGIAVYESPDPFLYPTQEVWRDTVGFALVTPICVYDIDQDSLPEIVKVLGDYTHLHIYECVDNNVYNTIAEITTSSTHNSSSTLAFGDFDSDNQNEFVWGYSGGEYSIWECIGNNSYQEIILQQLPTANIKDCFTVPDADGDGKPEFVVKGFVIPTGEIHAFIFEATGDNTYEIIKTFTLLGGDYYGGYSDVGDVDGDGIPEIALEGRQTVHIIKAAGNDSFYVWKTLPGNSGGSSVRVYDIDGNGLSEVIISGNNQTRIYEYQVGIEEEPGSEVRRSTLTVFPNPFSKLTTVSFSIEQSAKSIELKIYDASGRLVKDLHYAVPHAPCSMQISWDGTDQANRQLPGGVYFVELVTSNHKITSKIIKLE